MISGWTKVRLNGRVCKPLKYSPIQKSVQVLSTQRRQPLTIGCQTWPQRLFGQLDASSGNCLSAGEEFRHRRLVRGFPGGVSDPERVR